VLREVRAIAAEREATPAQVALAWLLEREVVDAPIIGPRTSEQLRDSLGALDVSLSAADRERIEAPITPRWPDRKKDV